MFSTLRNFGKLLIPTLNFSLMVYYQAIWCHQTASCSLAPFQHPITYVSGAFVLLSGFNNPPSSLRQLPYLPCENPPLVTHLQSFHFPCFAAQRVWMKVGQSSKKKKKEKKTRRAVVATETWNCSSWWWRNRENEKWHYPSVTRQSSNSKQCSLNVIPRNESSLELSTAGPPSTLETSWDFDR